MDNCPNCGLLLDDSELCNYCDWTRNGSQMSQANKKIIKQRISEAAEVLKDRLPESWKHPAGRNPHAHIPKVIKTVLGSSYTELPDGSIDAVLEIIDYCEEHPF
jgi:hypothetical protein